MNRADLVTRIATVTGLTKSATGTVFDVIFDVITATLARGEDVTITGFGAFSVVERAARTGRNPRTGEPVEIAASKAPRFSAGKSLRIGVNAHAVPTTSAAG